MVPAQNITTMTTDTTRFTKIALKKKGRKKEFRWRSTGWTPLAYPASALIADSAMSVLVTITDATEVNPFFPLDKDILRAATREMLILDGSVDGSDLKLKEVRTRFEKSSDVQMTRVFGVGPVYASHLQPAKWNRVKEEDAVFQADSAEGSTRKRKVLPSSIFISKKKVKKRAIFDDDRGPKKQQFIASDSSSDKAYTAEEIKTCVSSAVALVDLILDRARQNNNHAACVLEPVLSSDVKESLASSDPLERPPRKVSDVDQASVSDHPPVLLDLTEETCGDQDISLFVDIVNRKEDGSVTFLKNEIPSFLDVSIVFESSLRNAAFRMVSQMCNSFDDEALRLFLGYKSCALKRERVLRVLSDYLFDVSHAMFAWKQTESEILSERADTAVATQTSFCQEIDSLVRDSLFDERALKKIGGLDDSSILRHAIEISRSERRNEPWERFSKTATGRRLLSHHRTGRAYLVGQKRRGQRIKRFSSSASTDASEDGQRSRASSIASYDEVPESASQQQQESNTGPTIQNLSEVLDITLTRKVDKSWGVLLSREGDMCVVDRAPDKCCVRCGDMVLSVKNDRGESAAPPASSANNENWFKEIVNVFKGSNELHLVVRRVGCLSA